MLDLDLKSDATRYAVVKPGTDAHATWLHVFGTDAVAIVGEAFPMVIGGRLEICYRVDVSRLDVGQVRRAAERAGVDAGRDPESIEADIRGEYGLPIPGSGLAIGTNPEACRKVWARIEARQTSHQRN